jgi:hypothetical protein
MLIGAYDLAELMHHKATINQLLLKMQSAVFGIKLREGPVSGQVVVCQLVYVMTNKRSISFASK